MVSSSVGVAFGPGAGGATLATVGPAVAVMAGIAFGDGVVHRWELGVRAEARGDRIREAAAFLGVRAALYAEPDAPPVIPTIRAGLRAGYADDLPVLIGPHLVLGLERRLTPDVLVALELGGHATLTLPFRATLAIGFLIRAGG